MIKVLGENYYIDLDKVEEYLDMSNQYPDDETSGNTETRINIIKFEMVKMLMDTVLTEHEEIDEKTSEIPVFQKLVAELGLKDFIFTLDALHCQKKP